VTYLGFHLNKEHLFLPKHLNLFPLNKVNGIKCMAFLEKQPIKKLQKNLPEKKTPTGIKNRNSTSKAEIPFISKDTSILPLTTILKILNTMNKL
jgi:hypothetical protein